MVIFGFIVFLSCIVGGGMGNFCRLKGKLGFFMNGFLIGFFEMVVIFLGL